MTTTQHTSGPWKLTIGEYDAAIHTDATIARIEDESSSWKANARLIAAAPELLFWLKDLIGGIEDEFSSSTALGIRAKEALAALAKAEGRTE